MRQLLIPFIVFSLFVSAASAQTITPVFQYRAVNNSTTTVTAPDFGHFQTSIPYASQTSDIFETSLVASGSVGTSDFNRSAGSTFDVTFDLHGGATYTLAGSLHGTFSTAS